MVIHALHSSSVCMHLIMIAAIYMLFHPHVLWRSFYCSPKACVLSDGLTLFTLGPISLPVQLQCSASCWVLQLSWGQCVFFLFFSHPCLLGEVKATRKESHCLLLPPNQILFFHWNDGVLPKKYSFFMFGFYGLKKNPPPLFSFWTLVAYCAGWNGLAFCSLRMNFRQISEYVFS